ncbi:MAG TPA: helix-turn-helix domain-containing protein [Holophaga sp.]|nr:helix-turn-helix domain-containing protein [Holophaga sp.]
MAAPACRTIRPQGRRRLALPGCEELLLDAAANVFLRRGLRGGTIREIARRAGVSATMIYYHFGSKEGLACELVRRLQDRLLGDLAAFSREHGRAPLSREDRDGLTDLLERHLGQGRILGHLLLDPGVQRHAVLAEALEGLRRDVEGCLADSLDRGSPSGRASLDLQSLCRRTSSRSAIEPLVPMNESWNERFWWTLAAHEPDPRSKRPS